MKNIERELFSAHKEQYIIITSTTSCYFILILYALKKVTVFTTIKNDAHLQRNTRSRHKTISSIAQEVKFVECGRLFIIYKRNVK